MVRPAIAANNDMLHTYPLGLTLRPASEVPRMQE